MRKKKALHVLYPSDTARKNPQKTFVCFGVNRGGTSAVAGTMARLGVHMGKALPKNYEDRDFLAMMPRETMIERIKRANAERDVWGWKCPAASGYIEELIPYLNNLHVVLVTRDISAICQSRLRLNDEDPRQSYHTILLQQQSSWFTAERLSVPTALVSYETAMLRPQEFIEGLAEFLGCPLPDDLEEITNFLTPGEYKGLEGVTY